MHPNGWMNKARDRDGEERDWKEREGREEEERREGRERRRRRREGEREEEEGRNGKEGGVKRERMFKLLAPLLNQVSNSLLLARMDVFW